MGLPVVTLKLSSVAGISDLRLHICADNPEPEISKQLKFEPPLGEQRAQPTCVQLPLLLPTALACQATFGWPRTRSATRPACPSTANTP